MGNHVCPLCFAKVPRTLILTKTLEVNCPACHAELEVSRGSRVLASFVGILAAFVAVHLGGQASGTAGWTLADCGGGCVFWSLLRLGPDSVLRVGGASKDFSHCFSTYSRVTALPYY